MGRSRLCSRRDATGFGGSCASGASRRSEVQRSWVLLPCFLDVARRAGVEIIDLLELGSSAGLNLLWDRYRYRYEAGTWGAENAPLSLSGDERRPVPEELLRLRPRVRHRRGVDLADRPDGAEDTLLLKSFVWADQTARLERLDHAVETLRSGLLRSSAATSSSACRTRSRSGSSVP